MSNRIWKLYLHTSPNGKKYYGITSKNNPSERWGNNGENYKRHPYFYNAIKNTVGIILNMKLYLII